MQKICPDNPAVIQKTLRLVVFAAVCCSVLCSCVALLPFVQPDDTAIKNNNICQPGHKDDSLACAVADSSVRASVPSVTKKKQRIEQLKKQLSDPDAARRTNAATSLGEFGPAARMAIPALIYAVKYDSSKWVRRASVKALPKISSDQETIAALRYALNDKNSWVSHSAANALKHIGS